jgi:hypothetical protein
MPMLIGLGRIEYYRALLDPAKLQKSQKCVTAVRLVTFSAKLPEEDMVSS